MISPFLGWLGGDADKAHISAGSASGESTVPIAAGRRLPLRRRKEREREGKGRMPDLPTLLLCALRFLRKS